MLPYAYHEQAAAQDQGKAKAQPKTAALSVPPTRRERLIRFLLLWMRKAFGTRRAGVETPSPFRVAGNSTDWRDREHILAGTRRVDDALGNAFDTDMEANQYNRFRQMTFTFAVIALAAQLAKVDGRIKKEEFTAFCELFPLPFEEKGKIQALFAMASKEPPEVERYARQIMQLFPGRRRLMEELFIRLCRLAAADGVINPAERASLERIALSLDADCAVMDRLGGTAKSGAASPYSLLGISPRASDESVKKAYRERIRELHPDHAVAAGRMSCEVAAAQERLAEVNAAYRILAKKRKMK